MPLDCKRLVKLLAVVSFALAPGCDLGPPRVPGPDFNSSAEAKKAVQLYDTNKDGRISGDELDACPGLKAALKVMGTDRDRGITSEMIVERVESWIDSKIGRTSLSCQVTHNGQPLQNATVKFIPEKFLSDALQETASGKTNPTGMAMITLTIKPRPAPPPPEQNPNGLPPPEPPPPGIPPGIYRVEITKDGEEIPAKYNTESTLGQEVSLDNMDMQSGVKFDLKY
jgi:hypothetical protein